MAGRSSFLHKVLAPFRYTYRLATNGYFWLSLVGMAAALIGACVVVDNVLMPRYTRHDSVISAPNLVGNSLDEARDMLAAQGLQLGGPRERYSPADEPGHVEPGLVLEQRPDPHTPVKPGRTVYVTINRGEEPQVAVPDVVGHSVRGAKQTIAGSGLRIGSLLPDTLPSPYLNTITSQDPRPGIYLSRGDSLRLWYSTGLGTRSVLVPDVVGMAPDEATASLATAGLRAVLLDIKDDSADVRVSRQSRAPGSSVLEGFEVRLFSQPDSIAGSGVLLNNEH